MNPMQSPFYHYNSSFNPMSLISKYSVENLSSSKSFLTNFVGLKIAPEYMPESIRNRIGTVECPPIPANWHADISEFGAVLRAVDLSSTPYFIMGELGCGWGCWMGISGLLAKKKGLDITLYGIEGDKRHISWANENMVNNGFSQKEYHIVEGIASATSGKALFPIIDKGIMNYGLKPIFNASEQEVRKALESKSHSLLPMVTLGRLFRDESRVDLLHIDIQGGEVDLISGSMDYLSKHVSYLVIGTHSRSIEGKLIDILLKNGWIFEIERPAIFHMKQNELVTSVDGVQGWRNPDLIQEPQGINVVVGGKTIRAEFKGWSEEEPTHRWTECESCLIQFGFSENTKNLRKISLKGFSYGSQRVNFILNGKPIYKTTLTGEPQELEITVPKGTFQAGQNKLGLELPDAKVPDNGDSRKLGFALQDIKFL